MKKQVIALCTALSLVIPAVLAAGVIETLKNVWTQIIGIAGLNFLNLPSTTVLSALVRLLIWVLMFAIFFAVITGLNTIPPMQFFNRGQAALIAGVIATIAAIFLPASVLLAVGAGWATAIALILIGGPIVGLAYLLYTIPGPGKETKWTVIIKVIILLLMWLILAAIGHHIGVI